MAKPKKRPIGRSLTERDRAGVVASIVRSDRGDVVIVHSRATAALGAGPARALASTGGEDLAIALGNAGKLSLSNHREPYAFKSFNEALPALVDALGSLGVPAGTFFRIRTVDGREVRHLDARLTPRTGVRMLDEHEEFGDEPGSIISMTARGSTTSNDPGRRRFGRRR